MKVKFVLESNIVVDMTVSLGDLIVLDKFLTDHGGELTEVVDRDKTPQRYPLGYPECSRSIRKLRGKYCQSF